MKKLIFILILPIFLHSCKDNPQESNSKDSPQAASEKMGRNSEKDKLNDLLKVQTPQESQMVSSPLQLKGEARGYWFFEANAPVELLNEDFQPIAKNTITAKGEWMTEDYVPFKGTLEFPPPSTSRGYLIFHKANPSGLEENAVSDTMEVSFEN